MARKSNEFEQEMSALEAEIRRLEAEYNMFFAGRLPRLPWETRARVEALVKHYDRMHITNTAQRFRFSTLQARFVAFCELWERQLKMKEEGRRPRGRAGAAAPPPAPAAVPARAGRTHEPGRTRQQVIATASVRDPAGDADRVKQLYEQLSAARKQAGEPPLPFDRFAKVVRAQVSKLGRGAGEVTFRVAVQQGKVTLTAKPKGDE